MNNKFNICGASFEDLSDEELMYYDGGFAETISASVATAASSGVCAIISAGVSVLVTVTILMTADKI